MNTRKQTAIINALTKAGWGDAVMGSWSVKHGAFLDEQTIKNAVAMVTA